MSKSTLSSDDLDVIQSPAKSFSPTEQSKSMLFAHDLILALCEHASHKLVGCLYRYGLVQMIQGFEVNPRQADALQ